MKTTRIKIKNLFGIKETELGGQCVEITGTNGAGKTSVIDAIRYALTNSSDRQYIIRRGESEGEITIETDTGLSINRKKRETQSDYKSIKEGGRDVPAPENFLRSIFTPLQLDPVRFITLTPKEQNRIILDLIDYPWNLETIRGWFGELPHVNYDQNILQVLNDIQSENGDYFRERQDINREIRNNRAFVDELGASLPPAYRADVWKAYDIGAKYAELTRAKDANAKIERARLFRSSYDAKLRGIEAELEISRAKLKQNLQEEKDGIASEIGRLRQQISALEARTQGLDKEYAEKEKSALAICEANKAKLERDTGIAEQYMSGEKQDTEQMEAAIHEAEEMIRHLPDYDRMIEIQGKIKALAAESDELTRKIELARSLPGEILQTATIPVEGITVENGIPLIHGLPVSNLSEGEKLSLCVDVALSNPNALQIILIDGAEKLSTENRELLYQKCKDHGLQFVATRTTDDDTMEVHYL